MTVSPSKGMTPAEHRCVNRPAGLVVAEGPWGFATCKGCGETWLFNGCGAISLPPLLELVPPGGPGAVDGEPRMKRRVLLRVAGTLWGGTETMMLYQVLGWDAGRSAASVPLNRLPEALQEAFLARRPPASLYLFARVNLAAERPDDLEPEGWELAPDPAPLMEEER